MLHIIKSKYQGLIPHRRYLLIALILVGMISTPANAAMSPEKAAKQTWHRITTPNFVLITDISESNALELAEQIDRFRQFIAIVTSANDELQIRPITIFATKRGSSFDFFSNEKNSLRKMSGFFSDTLPATYAVVKLRGRHLARNNLQMYYHEYVHYLAATSTSYDLPYWFSEGFAEFLASIEFIGENKVNYGKPIQHHLQYIHNSRWVPVAEILAERRGEHKDLKRIRKTYSQGYYLTHYFYADDQRRKNLLEFINLRNDGMELEEAAERALGMSLDALNDEVRQYVNAPKKMRYLSITLAKSLKLEDFSVEELTPETLLTELAIFALRSHHGYDKADRWLRHALTINPEYAPALAGLAQTHLPKDIQQAKTYIDQAQALAPNDPYVATVKGHIYSGLFKFTSTEADEQATKTDYWTQAVRAYNQAINSGTINVEALVGASDLYYGRQSSDKIVELLQFAYQFAPNNGEVKQRFVWGLLHNQQFEDADYIADVIRNNPHHTDESLANFEKWFQTTKAKFQENQSPPTAAKIKKSEAAD